MTSSIADCGTPSVSSELAIRGSDLSWNQLMYLLRHGSLPPRKRKRCPVCSTRFLAPRRMGGGLANAMVYCSLGCRTKAQTLRARWYQEKLKMRRAAARSGKLCNYCGRHFRLSRSDAKYCCASHRTQAYRRRAKGLSGEREQTGRKSRTEGLIIDQARPGGSLPSTELLQGILDLGPCRLSASELGGDSQVR